MAIFRLRLTFQVGGPLFLHTSPGICQFLRTRQAVGVSMLRLKGLFRIQDTLQVLQAEPILLPALLLATTTMMMMMMMMMMPTGLSVTPLEKMTPSRISFLLQHNIAPAWVCMYSSCIFQTLPHGGPTMYVYYVSPLNGPRHVRIIFSHSGPRCMIFSFSLMMYV